jgi:transposase InsO family protein
VFEELVYNYGIKKKNSTPLNPQSNGIIERVHLTLNDALRTAEVDGRELDERYPWGTLYPLMLMQYVVHFIPH